MIWLALAQFARLVTEFCERRAEMPARPIVAAVQEAWTGQRAKLLKVTKE